MWGSKADGRSSGLGAEAALPSLLDAALPFFHAGVTLGAQLLRLRLLLGRQHREQLGAEPRLLDRQVRLHRRKVLHGGADAPLVNRQRLGGLLPCGLRRPQPFSQRARLQRIGMSES